MTRFGNAFCYMNYDEFKNSIVSKFSSMLAMDLSDAKCNIFFDYMNFLIEKNKVMNLTAIDEPEEIIVKHFVDSAGPLKIFGRDYFIGKKIADVGTGAGFPGLPLAILCDDAKFVLNDSLGKRIKFINEFLDREKEVKNVETLNARAEDFGQDVLYREKFDIVVSRAVSRTAILAEYTLPLLKVCGKLFLYKMNDCDEEIAEAKKAIETLGGKFHVKHSYVLVESEPQRCIVEIEKIKNTPKQFPRKPGTPAKAPLK